MSSSVTEPRHQNSIFTRIAKWASTQAGRPVAFGIASTVVVAWILSGPYFGYSDTWQLVINTSTTIVTFLMVFLIQNSQSRDTRALEIKLDELIRVTEGAHLMLLDIEELDDHVLQDLQTQYAELARAARDKQRPDVSKAGVPDMEPRLGPPDAEAE